jgi:dolichol-phosphate mannosyltransferase
MGMALKPDKNGSNLMHIALLVPTYNEAKNIPDLLQQIALQVQMMPSILLEVFIIDDGSPDQTAQIAQAHGGILNSDRFKVWVIIREKKEGLGSAYIAGFNNVLSRGIFDYVIQMDADLSHNPAYLGQFFDAAFRGVDFVVASRYLEGGSIPDWSWHRRFLSKFGNYFARMLLGSRVSDYTGGFNMYSAPLLERIDFGALQMSGYGFLIGLKFQALQQAKYLECFPIIFIDRVAGQSKMPINTAFKSFILVLKLWRKKSS